MRTAIHSRRRLPAPTRECARSALYLRWIPAPVQARGKLCAGMADICRASGKCFRAALDFRSFYTACLAAPPTGATSGLRPRLADSGVVRKNRFSSLRLRNGL